VYGRRTAFRCATDSRFTGFRVWQSICSLNTGRKFTVCWKTSHSWQWRIKGRRPLITDQGNPQFFFCLYHNIVSNWQIMLKTSSVLRNVKECIEWSAVNLIWVRLRLHRIRCRAQHRALTCVALRRLIRCEHGFCLITVYQSAVGINGMFLWIFGSFRFVNLK